jgi:hypothetical protein
MVLGDRSFDEGLGVECHPAVFFFPFLVSVVGHQRQQIQGTRSKVGKKQSVREMHNV